MSKKAKVLVVDDDPDVVEQLTVTLTKAGYDVVSGGSQDEAEQLLLSGRPDIAILDLMMDQMDSGFVVCHHLKQLYPDTPVILLTAVAAATGLSFSATSTEAKSWVKADKVLDKPVRTEQILAEVGRLLPQPAGKDAAAHHH